MRLMPWQRDFGFLRQYNGLNIQIRNVFRVSGVLPAEFHYFGLMPSPSYFLEAGACGDIYAANGWLWYLWRMFHACLSMAAITPASFLAIV